MKKSQSAKFMLYEWTIDRFKPYDRNPRKNDHAVSKMAKAIKDFGFRVPIVAKSTGEIVDGHLRLKAAVELKLDTVPVLLADDMTDAQIKAFRISVNQAATWADWDFDLLRGEIEALNEVGFDLGSLGFDDKQFAEIMKFQSTFRTDPDEAPEPPANPVSVLDDIWVLGEHRLICGDSTDPETVKALLKGARPHLMVTDPPYGVDYDADWRNRSFRADGSPIGGRAIGAVQNDGQSDWRSAWALFGGDVAYVWHAGLRANSVFDSLNAAGFVMRAQIIWAKQQIVIGRGDYHFKHEPCWYAVRKGKKGHWSGDRKQTTVWEIDKPQKSETGHSTQKPVECMRRPMENNSQISDAVYDPFVGSGTTIIAGEMIKRRIYAIELNPAYIDVCVRRWQDFTGKKAIWESSGETFAAIAKRRGVKIEATEKEQAGWAELA